MKYAAIFACLFAVALAQSNTPTTAKPTTTTTTVVTTTTTTAPPTTTSTTAPSTTTTAKTTTAKPTTPVPPTPKPTPDPVNPPRPDRLDAGTWNVTDKTLCLKAHFAAEIIVPYTASTGVVHNATIAVPPTAIASGTCDSLILSWPTSNMTTGNNQLFLNFTMTTIGNDTKKMWYMPQTILAVLRSDPFFFPNATEGSFPSGAVSVELINSTDFTAPVNNSFRCYTERQLQANMTDPSVKDHAGFFLFKDVQIQPFVPSDSTGFGAAITCDLDRGLTSDIVPIAVGCALAGLVVVVIIAYIIGRRRSRQSGYTSV